MAVIPGEPEADIQATDTLQVLDPAGVKPARIIKTTDPFKVAMEFELISATAQDLAGTLSYEIKYFAESMGKGPEYDLGTVRDRTLDNQYKYNATTPAGAETALDVAAGTMDPGVYRVAAMVSFKLNCPPERPRPYRMTAFVEGPAIEVYRP
jgi:hypothetical protein